MWPIGIDQLASTLSRERCDVADRHRSAGIYLRACQEITPQIVMLSAAKNLCPISRDPSLRYPETCAMAGVRPPMNSAGCPTASGYTTAAGESAQPALPRA